VDEDGPSPPSERLTDGRWRAAGLLALVALSALPRLDGLARRGVSPDEEISVFSVRGISAAGLPRLPSGRVYHRGLAYSYAAWASGRVFGDDLRAYRIPSLLAGCALVGLAAVAAARMGGSALLAGLLTAGATWLVVTSVWARFYSLSAVAFLATTVVLLRPHQDRRRDAWFLGGLVVSSLLHEMAVTLLAVPAFHLVRSSPGSPEWRRFGRLLLVSIFTLALVQLALASLNRDTPGVTGATALIGATAGAPRLVPALLARGSALGFAWLGLAAAAATLSVRLVGAGWPVCIAAGLCCATLNVGVLAIGAAALALARPREVRATAAAVLIAAAVSVLSWSAYVWGHTASGFDAALVTSLGQASVAYPLDGLAELVRRWPVAAACAVAGLVAGWRAPEVRLTASVALAMLTFLGVTTIGPKPRYFVPLLPLLFALAAVIPAALSTLARKVALRRLVAIAAAVALGCVLLAEHERGAGDVLLERGGTFGLSRLRSAPFERWAAALDTRATDGPIVCTDDLGCLLVGRRPDYWWLGSKLEAERYGVRGGGGWRSSYTGARILIAEEGTRALASRELRGGWLITLHTVKYPGPQTSDLRAAGDNLQAVCQAEGMVVLRIQGGAERPGPISAEEAPPCASG
jgi:hypothetical protein